MVKYQLYIAQKSIGEENYKCLKSLILEILSDFRCYKKNQGWEITVYADTLKLLSKSIRPLPVVKEKEGEIFDAFADKELRYRNRHVDLIVTPGVKETFVKRSKIIANIRKILTEKDFLEVETPILQPIYGGAAARPFTTHHNALDITLYMRISLETYQKKLIVGGMDRVFELSKVFRNEGIDKTHNPEFTLLELYQAYGDYESVMGITAELFERTAIEVNGTTKCKWQGQEIELKRPWKRMKMTEAVKEYTGMDVKAMSDDELKEVLEKQNIKLKDLQEVMQ